MNQPTYFRTDLPPNNPAPDLMHPPAAQGEEYMRTQASIDQPHSVIDESQIGSLESNQFSPKGEQSGNSLPCPQEPTDKHGERIEGFINGQPVEANVQMIGEPRVIHGPYEEGEGALRYALSSMTAERDWWCTAAVVFGMSALGLLIALLCVVASHSHP